MANSPEKERTKRRLRREFKRRKTIETILEWAVSLVGLVLGIVSLVWSNTIEALTLLLLIAIDVVLVFFLGVKSQVGKGITEAQDELAQIRHEDEVADLLSDVEEARQSLEAEKAESSALIRAKDESTEMLLGQIEILSRYELQALSSLSEIMIEWTDATSRIYQHEADLRAASDDGEIDELHQAYIRESLQKETERTRNAFFARHRQFLGHVVDAVQQCTESHLHARGLDHEVSVAVKLFMFPSTDADLLVQCTERNVYTGFRDQRSWNSIRQQAYPTPVFSVAGNTDFSFCLRNRRVFIFNNERKSESYENESSAFPTHYNCGATACITGPLANEVDVQWCYGFIACDVNNKNEKGEPNKDEPIDEVVGNLMELAAHLLGIYYDRLEDMWFNLNGDTEFQKNYTDFPSPESSVESLQDVSLEERAASFFYNYYRYVDGHRGWPGDATTGA